MEKKKRKPTNYWNVKENCIEDARKYNTRTEWRKNSISAYKSACKNQWMNECCKHMVRKLKWTKEICTKIAKKYKTRNEFKKNDNQAYQVSLKRNYLDDICSHMKPKKKMVFWTKEECIEDARKYNTRTEWQKKSGSAYQSACKNKWLDECCKHMVNGKIKRTKEECHEYALKCNTKNEFKKKYPNVYSTAYYNKWLDEICKHMYHLGSKFKRLIYVYIFPDRSVYVGLTCNEKRRIDEHIKYRSTVKNYIEKTGFKPKYKKLTNYIPREEAIILEQEYVERYKKGGYKILNKIKAGGLGGGERRWKKEMCHEYALKCNTRSEFIKKYPNVYSAALKYKWLDDICSHMEYFFVKLTKEDCIEDARKYNTRTEWRKNSNSAYRTAIKNQWMNECCKHMVSGKIKWTKEDCIEDAKKYKTRYEWQKNSKGGYAAALRNKWLDECYGHMEKKETKPLNYWNVKENCIEDARKYNTRTEWQKKSGSAYQSARKNKWLDECCKHMVSNFIKWTKEECIEDARKYKTKVEWLKKSKRAYDAAYRNKWLDECFPPKELIESLEMV